MKTLRLTGWKKCLINSQLSPNRSDTCVSCASPVGVRALVKLFIVFVRNSPFTRNNGGIPTANQMTVLLKNLSQICGQLFSRVTLNCRWSHAIQTRVFIPISTQMRAFLPENACLLGSSY